MSEPEAASTKADLDALKALQADVPELERIESLLDRFNAFEAVPGFDKDEVMHSNILASLLDPRRTGALGNLLIREVLRETLEAGRETVPPASFGGLGRVLDTLDSMDFRDTLVRREHHDIDVLLENEDHKLAMIMENKVRAGEGHGQLEKYDRFVRHTRPGWDVLKIYLTPHGIEPSRKDYVPFSYGALCDIVDRLVKDRGSAIDPEVRVPAQHYARMVRRRILGDPEVVRLAQDLYEKHKRAFDFVYRHLPDIAGQIKETVEGLVTSEPRLMLDRSQKNKIRFGVPAWNTPALLASEDRPPSERMLQFELWNDSLGLNLNLFIGPGPMETREKLLGMVRKNPGVFMEQSLGGGRKPIFHRTILTKEQAYENLDRGEREQEIRRRWKHFIERDLPRMDEALRDETWIWGAVEENNPT